MFGEQPVQFAGDWIMLLIVLRPEYTVNGRPLSHRVVPEIRQPDTIAFSTLLPGANI
jgi:hypothetical protein